MWRDLEEEAIFLGLSLSTFWSLNPVQYSKHLKAYERRYKQNLIDRDYLNNILAQYITIGVNNPKKFPKPYLGEDIKPKQMTDEEMERRARLNTIRMGGAINDS